MSFFKKLADHARQSNKESCERSIELMRQETERIEGKLAAFREQEAERDSRECCANCAYFIHYKYERKLWCSQLDIDYDDMYWSDRYEKTCYRFYRKKN